MILKHTKIKSQILVKKKRLDKKSRAKPVAKATTGLSSE